MGRAVGLARRRALRPLAAGARRQQCGDRLARRGSALRARHIFAAAGTAGQRCTTLRRLIVHRTIYDTLLPTLQRAYATLRVGNPLVRARSSGRWSMQPAYTRMQAALALARKAGASVSGGEAVHPPGLEGGYYVRPALVELGRADRDGRARRPSPDPLRIPI